MPFDDVSAHASGGRSCAAKRSSHCTAERAEVYLTHASCHERAGGGDQMTADLDRYIALTPGPKDWRGFSNRAWAFHKLGQSERGLPDANRALLSSGRLTALGTRRYLCNPRPSRRGICRSRRRTFLKPRTVLRSGSAGWAGKIGNGWKCLRKDAIPSTGEWFPWRSETRHCRKSPYSVVLSYLCLPQGQ
jgi:hypothetical protein